MTTGVWSSAPAAEIADPTDWLSLDDGVRRRLARLRDPRDRHAFLAARALAARAAARVLGVDRADVLLVQRCGVCGSSDHGKPAVSGHGRLAVSWAHTREHVVAAASPQDVAVDVEETIASAPAFDARVLTPDERAWSREGASNALARLWCRKECAVKLGWLTLDELSDVTFVVDGRLLERVRGLAVLDRSTDGLALVALTRAELVWSPPVPL